jgi:hypothetical protein
MLEGRGADWGPVDELDALDAIDAASEFCRGHCPIFDACVGDACHVYRVEHVASSYLEEGPASQVGVLDQATLGVV